MNLSGMLDKRALQNALRRNADVVVSIPDNTAFYGTIDVVWVAEANKLVILCESERPGPALHDLRHLLAEDT